MIVNVKNKKKTSLLRETIDTLNEIEFRPVHKYSIKTKSANEFIAKNHLGYLGIKFTNYSIRLKALDTSKPKTLPIAGS